MTAFSPHGQAIQGAETLMQPIVTIPDTLKLSRSFSIPHSSAIDKYSSSFFRSTIRVRAIDRATTSGAATDPRSFTLLTNRGGSQEKQLPMSMPQASGQG